MIPREHGAYGQLLFPIVVALAIGRPAIAAITLTLAALALFLAHEPLLVVLGQRGSRATRERSADAWRWLLVEAAAALVFGGIALVFASPAVRAAVTIPAMLGAMVVAAIAAGREHTSMGETLSAFALSSIAFPIALASGASDSAALTVAIVFAFAASTATLAVRAVIAAPRPHGRRARATAVACSVLAVALAVALSRIQLIAAIAWQILAMQAAVNIALAAIAPSPLYLRYVGWSLFGASTLVAALLIAAMR